MVGISTLLKHSLLEKCGRSVNERLRERNRFWGKYGAKVSRSVKTLRMVSQTEFVRQRVEQVLSEGEKCVLVLRSTFSTLVQEAYRHQKQAEIGNMDFSIQSLLRSFISDIKTDFEEWHKYPELVVTETELENKIAAFPPLALSVIDALKEQIGRATGQEVLEISGRSHCVVTDAAGSRLVPRNENTSRSEALTLFNNGDDTGRSYDVIILSAAGSTGLSLHAGEKFKDQRVRRMIELEISPMTLEREQFFGRVNRTGQVTLPKLETIVSSHPTARRVYERETEKLGLTRDFIASGAQTERGGVFNEAADWACRHFLCEHPRIAEKMNVRPDKKADAANEFPVLSAVMARSFFLDGVLRDRLEEMLEKATENHKYASSVSELLWKLDEADIKQIVPTKLFECGTAPQGLRVREKLNRHSPELYRCDIVLKEGSCANRTVEINPQPLFPHLVFSKKTVKDKEAANKMAANAELLKKLYIGCPIQFRLDGCTIAGTVISGAADKDLPYPEFQRISVAVHADASDTVVPNAADICLPLNYLLSNAYLKIAEPPASPVSRPDKTVSVVLGHPVLLAWVASFMKRNVALGNLHTRSGDRYPMLVVPHVLVARLSALFSSKRPVLNGEELKHVLKRGETIVTASGSICIEPSGKEADVTVFPGLFDRDDVLSDKAKQCLVDSGRPPVVVGKLWRFRTDIRAAAVVAFSYLGSTGGQWFSDIRINRTS